MGRGVRLGNKFGKGWDWRAHLEGPHGHCKEFCCALNVIGTLPSHGVCCGLFLGPSFIPKSETRNGIVVA